MKLFKSKISLFILSLLFLNDISAAELIIKKGNQKLVINSVNIKGTEYVASNTLAKALDANYFYNPTKQKSELKFIEYNLKFTANNQFVILIAKKSNQNQIFQMPLSAKLMEGDIFIPVKYSVKYLSFATGLETTYIENDNSIIIASKKLNTKKLVEWNKRLVDRNSIKYDIFSANIENKTNGTLLRLATKDRIIKPTSSISNNTLYIFFSGATIDKNEISKLTSKGFIKSIELKHVNGNPQMEIKLKEGYDRHEIFYDDEIGEILVSIHSKFTKAEIKPDEEINKWKFNVVVIDPGHGGKDPGAIGVNGIKEKDINLAIAKELGSLIKRNNNDLDVVYTRDDDTFVELYKRGKIANENKGDLFISIHCNSMPKKRSNVRGFEVYLLRPGRTKEAIDIAEFENSVISLEDNPNRYKKLTDENFILVSMANASNMRYSETFADMLNTEWIKQDFLPSRGIKQAGFYVLVGASMPGILIESGYISNKEDAKYLNTKRGQQQVANSIYEAIIKYKNYYETSLNNELDK